MPSHTKNKAAEAQARFDQLRGQSFAKQQDATLRKRMNLFEENKKFNSQISSNSSSTESPFSPANIPQNTAANAQFANQSVQDNEKTNNSKKQLAATNRSKADAVRKANTPAIKQADIRQQPLFNLGF